MLHLVAVLHRRIAHRQERARISQRRFHRARLRIPSDRRRRKINYRHRAEMPVDQLCLRRHLQSDLRHVAKARRYDLSDRVSEARVHFADELKPRALARQRVDRARHVCRAYLRHIRRRVRHIDLRPHRIRARQRDRCLLQLPIETVGNDLRPNLIVAVGRFHFDLDIIHIHIAVDLDRVLCRRQMQFPLDRLLVHRRIEHVHHHDRSHLVQAEEHFHRLAQRVFARVRRVAQRRHRIVVRVAQHRLIRPRRACRFSNRRRTYHQRDTRRLPCDLIELRALFSHVYSVSVSSHSNLSLPLPGSPTSNEPR